MATIVTITDITRMAPPFVCVAGVDDKRQNIRIEFTKSRIDEDWLCVDGQAVVRPFARLGLDLFVNRPDPPHTEDWLVNKLVKQPHGLLSDTERHQFINSILDRSVSDIFDTQIQENPGFYVRKGGGTRSLGTIRVDRLDQVSYQCYGKDWDYRLRFRDNRGDTYTLKVKDLTFCAYLDYLREKENVSCESIEHLLLLALSGKECYLRIGLARGWANYPDRCYLQITGVYSFPDYLDGRCFTDFMTPRAYRPAQPVYMPSDWEERVVKESPTSQDTFPKGQQTPISNAARPNAPKVIHLPGSKATQDTVHSLSDLDENGPDQPALLKKRSLKSIFEELFRKN